MVDPKVFYTGNHEIYASKQPKGPYLISNKPADIIKWLAEPIYSSGRNITADNRLTDINLICDSVTLRINPNYLLNLCLLKTDLKNPVYLLLVQIAHLYLIYPKREKRNFSFKYAFWWHRKFRFTKAWCNRMLQPPETVVDTVDQMIGAYNVARNTKRWPMVMFYTILNIAGINAQIIHILNSNMK